MCKRHPGAGGAISARVPKSAIKMIFGMVCAYFSVAFSQRNDT
jgi:hypothetical protein